MTSIPVPEVLAWSSDSSNPVGAEYLILEKCPGRQLQTVWGDLDQLRWFELIKTIANFDNQLASIAFPANGNLYLRASEPENSVPLDMDKGPQGMYCIRPVFSDSWLRNTSEATSKELEVGSWPHLRAFGLAWARQGAWHVKNTEYRGAHGPHFGSPDSHLQVLEFPMKVISVLARAPFMQRHARPTLWHTDLHIGNIFVSEETSPEIVGVIDWQFISILPELAQAQWPQFFIPPENYEMGATIPKLPLKFEEMDPDEKAYAISQREQAMQTKCYELALSCFHHDSYLCLTEMPEVLQTLFILCEQTYKDGIMPLKDCLIRLSNNWETIGLTGSPPMLLSEDELAIHEIQMADYRDWVKLRKHTQQVLISDDDGWVHPDLDSDEIQAEKRALFELYLQRLAPETTTEEAKQLWFYDQHDSKA